MSFNPLSHSLRPQSLQAFREKYTEIWNHRSTYYPCALVPNVRLCEAQSPILKRKDNWTKWPQRTTVSHLPESFGSTHRQPLFQPLQQGEHRRIVRKDLWATVQSVALREKQIWSQSECLFLTPEECHLGRSLERDILGPCDTQTSLYSFSTHRHLPMSA